MTGGESTDYCIRGARAEDYDGIVEVWRQCGLRTSAEGRESRESFSRQVEAFPETYLVAESGGKIVGVVLGSHDYRKGWINRLAVLPELQRRGIASGLVRACEAGLRKQGLGILAAHVEPGNRSSAALFEKLGYGDELVVRYFRKLIDPQA